MTVFKLRSVLCRLLETEETCPMCSERVISQNLEKVRDFQRILNPDEGDDEWASDRGILDDKV